MADCIIEIDNMTEQDLLQVSEIEKECFSMPWSYEDFRDTLTSEYYKYVVARCEGRVVGYCGAIISFDEADITNIAVSEEYRGLHIGNEILKNFIRLLEGSGVNKVHLEVRQSNAVAIGLYSKNGFEKDGIRKGFYQKPTEDAILMTRTSPN